MCGLKHQKEKRSMAYFAGLDVSVKETSVCIVDDAGKIVREARVALLAAPTRKDPPTCYARAPRDQRTASTYIFGAVCPKEGKGAALIMPACNTEAMNLHLAEIAATVAPA